MTTTTQPALEYGTEPRRPRLRRLVFRCVLAAAIAFGGYAGWRWGVPLATALWEQSRYLSMQRGWLDHADSLNLVVFETDPDEVARLKASGSYGSASIPAVRGHTPPLPSAGLRTGVYDELDRSFRRRGRAGGFAGGGVLLRRLRSPGGTERIVLVAALLRQTPPDGVNAELWWFTSPLATMRPGSRVSTQSHGKIQPYLKPGERVRIYAAQPGPADQSHFTATYYVNDERGQIEGWLRDDGTLDVRVRDGPLAGR
ncbi:MAG TPA: hypothetical protein VFB66_02590 [Tepidisphaeraceae bacterium]|nr:hypothetical protein [Tepidisphaeraceae bacterium]